MDIFFCRMMLRIQRYQNFGIRSPDCSTVAVRKINSTVRQTNVIENGLDFILWDFAPDFLFHQIYQTCRFLNSQPRAPAHVQTELASIDFGEKVPPKKKHQSAR